MFQGNERMVVSWSYLRCSGQAERVAPHSVIVQTGTVELRDTLIIGVKYARCSSSRDNERSTP